VLLKDEQFRTVFQSRGVTDRETFSVPSVVYGTLRKTFTVCRVNPSMVTQSFTKLTVRRLDLPFLIVTTRSFKVTNQAYSLCNVTQPMRFIAVRQRSAPRWTVKYVDLPHGNGNY
jgi:hypothetical protein